MKKEYRISINELAKIVGVSSSTLRTWISSYKFAKFIRYDNALSEKPKLNVVLNKNFCNEFIPYLAMKDLKRKNYVKKFNNGIDKLAEEEALVL